MTSASWFEVSAFVCIISTLSLYGMTIIVSKLPSLGFTPLYINNTTNIQVYNNTIDELSEEMHYHICDMSGTEEFYIDGVHYTHEGYNMLANIFADEILNLLHAEDQGWES